MSKEYMEKPCQHCPFRKDVTPFLHPERAEEIAYSAQNYAASFPCHKTTESDGNGECFATEASKECAGFLTLRAQAGERIPEGFKPSFELVYTSDYEMVEAYDEEWNKAHGETP